MNRFNEYQICLSPDVIIFHSFPESKCPPKQILQSLVWIEEIVGAYKEQVFNLNFEIGALNGANNALEIKIGSLGKQLSFSNIQLVEKESIIVSKESLISAQKISNESLKKQLQKQNNFFNRNKFWIGAGLGVLGVLIVK